MKNTIPQLPRLTLVTLILFLTSCGVFHRLSPPSNEQQTWTARQSKLKKINQWDVKGALGVTGPKKGWSATVNWHQKGPYYKISLIAPLGGGTATIERKANLVVMTTSDKKTMTAKNADLLVRRQTGMSIPIENMTYWIRGIPAPGIASDKQFDQYNHLVSLQQQGWNIRFLRYSAINGQDLPSKIVMQHAPYKVKMVVNSWEIA